MDEEKLIETVNWIEDLQNKMNIIDSLAYTIFLAASINITDTGELSGAIYLLSEKINAVCNDLKKIEKEMQSLT